MINQDRIVPVMSTDLVTLYSVILAAAGVTLTKVDATDADGDFSVTSASGALIASEPVSTMDFGESVTTATVYFVPSYNFTGFTTNGTPAGLTGTVNADGSTLYKAELASGSVTVTQIGL